MRHLGFGLAMLVGFAGVCAASSDVYSYKDASGQTHFTDRWRPGAVLVKRGTASAQRSQPPSQPNVTRPADSGQAERIRNDLQQAAMARLVQADVQKKREEQCKKATEAYDKSIAARRIYKQDEKGNREFLSDAEADQARLRARQERDAACSPR